jgi:hypothetical protein
MCLNEVFRPTICQDRRVFMGLDTIITGDCDWLLDYNGDFAFTKAPVVPYKTPNAHVCNAVVAWDSKVGDHLWFNYMRDPEAYETQYTAPWSQGMGSEMVYWRECQEEFDILDDLFPGELASFNHDVKKTNHFESFSIVYFHGDSKPSSSYVPESLKRLWV